MPQTITETELALYTLAGQHFVYNEDTDIDKIWSATWPRPVFITMAFDLDSTFRKGITHVWDEDAGIWFPVTVINDAS